MDWVRENPATTIAAVCAVLLGAYALLTPSNVLLFFVVPAIVFLAVGRMVDGGSEPPVEPAPGRK